MMRRWISFGILFIALGSQLAYRVIAAEDQKPWLIALGVYFLAAAIIGNWFVLFGDDGERKKRSIGCTLSANFSL